MPDAADADTTVPGPSLVRASLAPGEHAAWPAVTDERALYVLEGEGVVDLGQRPLAVGAGAVLRIAPGHAVCARNTDASRPLVVVAATAAAGPRSEPPFAAARRRVAWVLRRIAHRLAK